MSRLEFLMDEIREVDKMLPSDPWHCNKNDLVGGWSIGTVKGIASEVKDYGNIADFLTVENATGIILMRHIIHKLATS